MFHSVFSSDNTFTTIYDVLESENFFKADAIYKSLKNSISPMERMYVEAVLDNAFNRIDRSQRIIDEIIKKDNPLPDQLMADLYRISNYNYLKSHNYLGAAKAINTLLENYKKEFSYTEILDLKNTLSFCSTLQNEANQRVIVDQTSSINITKDRVGLNTLRISFENDSVDFVMDTGASMSVVTSSVAERFKMKMLCKKILITTATRKKVKAEIALCPLFRIGDIKVENSVFLVVSDKSMSFPQADYQINGIIGLPIILDMGEIQITKSGVLIVPKEKTNFEREPNLAFSGFKLLIGIDGLHYNFDTGANETMLYNSYYDENKKEIDSLYKVKTISFAGVGGRKNRDGFRIKHNFKIYDKEVQLDNLILIKGETGINDTLYGNIGNDVFGRFDKMVLNFEKMFVSFGD